MRWTRGFDEIGGTDVANAGGEGANLGELTRAGLPVPPGFVVLTAAYDAFVAAHGLQALIADTPGPDDPAALAAAASRIRATFHGRAVPDAVAADVRAALGRLGPGRSRCARRPPSRTSPTPAPPVSRTRS